MEEWDLKTAEHNYVTQIIKINTILYLISFLLVWFGNDY